MSEFERRALLGAAGVAGMAALARAGGAGPIDPPAGAVGPSGHTLDDVYNKIPSFPNGSGDGRIAIAGGSTPIIISQSGSYVLTGNIAVGAAVAVTISASHVTLDLNGFAVSAAVGASSVVSIGPSSSTTNVDVRNGTVAGGVIGVALSGAANLTLEDLRIVGPKQYGIVTQSGGTQARNVVVRRCRVMDVGASTTSADSNMTIIAISISSAGTVIADNAIGSLSYNGSGTVTFRAISISGPGAASALIAGNLINCSPAVVSTSTFPSTGISFATNIAGVVRNNTVIGFTTPYAAFNGAGGVMTDGGGNV
ncbi:MAG: hypothetical protein QM783_08345 [Phycisphaerales bacterium]